jgi:hypothetical protein
VGEYDRSSKWLIQHHGDAILRLAGVGDVVWWRPLQAELVQPGQLPDGVLEVQCPNQPGPDLFVLEIATYPEQRLQEQLLRDSLLVYLDRRVLPEVIGLVLHPKGIFRVAESIQLESQRGWTRWQATWRIVELWTLPAQELLRTGDPGLMPWVPLTAYEGQPEPVLEQCREIIDREALTSERLNLLAVTQVLAKLRYNDPRLLGILGGRDVMIESPLIQEIVAETKHEAILTFLRARFGSVPEPVVSALRSIQDVHRLDELVDLAGRCPDLESFSDQVRSVS